MRSIIGLGMVLAVAFVVTGAVWAQDAPRVLFLSKSSGFEHSSIKQKDGQPSHVENVLKEVAEASGAELTATKDAGLINAENLKNYDLVIFYTTGDLTKAGGDGNPPMGPKGVEDLKAWVKGGGGFMGFHCAVDTFGQHWKDPALPYIGFIGGEFATHGRQFEGTLKVVDPTHPAAANIPKDWTKRDEWYMFKNLNKDKIHVIALMDPGAEREKQEKYDVPNYPVIWCSAYGEGRVFYNAMGHREDVWDDPTFQAMLVDGALWAMGQSELQADPNYAEVVPGGK